MDLTALPQAFRRKPNGVVGGQFSMHFTAAVAAQTGNLSWDDYDQYLTDPTTLALAQRIDVQEDSEMDAIYPERMGGKVSIRLTDGSLQSSMYRNPQGRAGKFSRCQSASLQIYILGSTGNGRASVSTCNRNLWLLAALESLNELFLEAS